MSQGFGLHTPLHVHLSARCIEHISRQDRLTSANKKRSAFWELQRVTMNAEGIPGTKRTVEKHDQCYIHT